MDRLPPSAERIPRLPLVPDPLRRVQVPRDLRSVTTIGRRKRTPRKWDCRCARSTASGQRHATSIRPACIRPSQLCLRRNGKVVLDRAIGHARGNGPDDPPDAPKVLATPDTPFCVYSTSKAITAIVIHLLHERGALSIYDRVTDYIPEYAQHGKDETTIAHVLSHRAGVPTLPRKILDIENVSDRELIIETISEPSRSSSQARCSPTTPSPAASFSARSCSG